MVLPINNRMIITMVVKEKTTSSGLILSESVEVTEFQTGRVERVSAKFDLDLTVGTEVLFPHGLASAIGDVDGEFLLNESDIVAVNSGN